MDQNALQHVVSAPALRLARPVALWGGGAGLVAIALAFGWGVPDSAALGVVVVVLAAFTGFGLLWSLKPRSICRWALPVMLAQMMRTLLAPAIGLGVALLVEVNPFGFWLSLLATAGAMLVGESVAIVRIFRTPGSCRGEGGEVTA